MNIYKIETPDGLSVLRMQGKCVASSVGVLQKAIEGLPDSNSNRVILNFRNINMIDSYALGYLADCLKDIQKKNGQLRLCHLQSFVYKILSMSDMDKHFDICTTEDEAIESIKGILQEA